MPTFKIKNAELAEAVSQKQHAFPKYTSQIINLANQNAQGTRPRIVGQMTELFREFGGKNYEEWEAWYKTQKPEALDDATDRIYSMVEKLREAVQQIDKSMVREWVEDIVLVKNLYRSVLSGSYSGKDCTTQRG